MILAAPRAEVLIRQVRPLLAVWESLTGFKTAIWVKLHTGIVTRSSLTVIASTLFKILVMLLSLIPLAVLARIVYFHQRIELVLIQITSFAQALQQFHRLLLQVTMRVSESIKIKHSLSKQLNAN